MATDRRRGEIIEELVAADDWVGARRAIKAELRLSPDSHWLLSRLALTHYEQREYARALEVETRALQLAPRCPLALWGLAGAYDGLGRSQEAKAIYMRLIRRGAEHLAYGECGEGIRWSRGLIADCWYRLGKQQEEHRNIAGARAAFRRYLSLRSRGASIYSARDARSRLKALQGLS